MNNRLLFRRAVYRGTPRKFVRFVYFDVLKHNQIKDSRIDLDNDIDQCLGLKDSNGKLIYEGDIILSNIEYGGTHFVIVGDVRGYCYDAVAVGEYKQYLANGKETWGGLSSTAYHIITDHGPCEVIGNIHENPELLEDK